MKRDGRMTSEPIYNPFKLILKFEKYLSESVRIEIVSKWVDIHPIHSNQIHSSLKNIK